MADEGKTPSERVDALWAQLQASDAGGPPRRATDALASLAARRDARSAARKPGPTLSLPAGMSLPKSLRAPKAAAASEASTALATDAKETVAAATASPHSDVRTVDDFDSMADFLVALQRDVNALADAAVGARRAALERLSVACFGVVLPSDEPKHVAGRPTDDPAAPETTTAVSSSALVPHTSAPGGGGAGGAAGGGGGGPVGRTPDSDDEAEDDDEAGVGSSARASSSSSSSSARDRRLIRRQHWVRDAFGSALLKPLLRRFSDPSERCRELAVRLVHRGLELVDDLSPWIPYTLPALLERLAASWSYDLAEHVFVRDMEAHDAHRRGRVVDEDAALVDVVEPSEEVRLLFARCLHALVEQARRLAALALLRPHMHVVLVAAQALARDPFPELKCEACELLLILLREMPDVSKHYAIGLVKALAPGLDHRQHRVRLATIEAVAAAVACEDAAKQKGAGSEAIQFLVGHRDENVIPIKAFYGPDLMVNYFGKLILDPNPLVRERFIRMIGDWMWSLPDRYDHESRLLPFLLSGLGDDLPALQSLALDFLEAIGRRHEEEKQDQILEKRQYGIDGDARVDYHRPLPGPFPARPRLGTRLFVRANCRRFLQPILRELADWRSGARRRAAHLLNSVVVFMEEHITQDAHQFLRVLLRLLDAEDVQDKIVELADLVGRFVDPGAFLPLLLPMLTDDASPAVAACAVASDTEAIGRVLRVLALLLRGARPSRVLPHLPDILRALKDPALVRFVTKPTVDARVTESRGRKAGALSVAVAVATATTAPLGGAGTARPLEGRRADAHPAALRSTTRPPPHVPVGEPFHDVSIASLPTLEAIVEPSSLPGDRSDGHIRSRFLQLVAVLSLVAEGRWATVAAATFEERGRFPDVDQEITFLLRTLLILRGQGPAHTESDGGVASAGSLVARAPTAASSATRSWTTTHAAERAILALATTAPLPTLDADVAVASLRSLIRPRWSALFNDALTHFPTSAFWTRQAPEQVLVLQLVELAEPLHLVDHAEAVLDLSVTLAQNAGVVVARSGEDSSGVVVEEPSAAAVPVEAVLLAVDVLLAIWTQSEHQPAVRHALAALIPRVCVELLDVDGARADTDARAAARRQGEGWMTSRPLLERWARLFRAVCGSGGDERGGEEVEREAGMRHREFATPLLGAARRALASPQSSPSSRQWTVEGVAALTSTLCAGTEHDEDLPKQAFDVLAHVGDDSDARVRQAAAEALLEVAQYRGWLRARPDSATEDERAEYGAALRQIAVWLRRDVTAEHEAEPAAEGGAEELEAAWIALAFGLAVWDPALALATLGSEEDPGLAEWKEHCEVLLTLGRRRDREQAQERDA